MDQKEFTEEQKAALKKLQKKFALRMAGKGVQFALTILFSVAAICAIDVLYVHNQAFVMISGFMSGLLISRSYRHSLAQEHDRVKEEVKKILEQ